MAVSERGVKSGPSSTTSVEFAAIGKKRVEEFTKAQVDLLDKLQEANRRWVERMQSEANLTTEVAEKLSTARSIPDAINVYQEWTNRRFELMADDGKHLLEDTQKFIEAAARLTANSWMSGRPGIST